MVPTFSFLISSGSKKKEPRYECLSEAKASHAQHELRFPSQYTSYKWGYCSAPLHMSPQGVVSSKKTNDDPGLRPIKGK